MIKTNVAQTNGSKGRYLLMISIILIFTNLTRDENHDSNPAEFLRTFDNFMANTVHIEALNRCHTAWNGLDKRSGLSCELVSTTVNVWLLGFGIGFDSFDWNIPKSDLKSHIKIHFPLQPINIWAMASDWKQPY